MLYGMKLEHFDEVVDDNGNNILQCKIVDESRGQWIPHDFANMYPSWCTETELNILSNPENADYLDTWIALMKTFKLYIDKKPFILYHNKSLYLSECGANKY